MAKYDKMVEHNKKVAKIKEEAAIKEIRRCLEEHEPINALRLSKLLGLSRAFFYTNERVHEVYVLARRQQDLSVWVRPERKVLDTAMEKHIQLLQMQIQKLEKENQKLRIENDKLKKALNKNDLDVINSLF